MGISRGSDNQKDQYDYVVVGAGTAGSVMASRLSERSDVCVLLLEAGPADGPETMRVPASWPSLMGSEADWGYKTVAQQGLGGAIIPYPRGKVLGGCSSINGMVHLRGHWSAIDAWVAAGADGWGYDDLLPYFRRSEHTEGLDTRYRGVGGPMKPVFPATVHPVARAFFEAVQECGYPVSADLNGADAEGVAWYELTVANGARQSAADAYLRPFLDRPNLTVVTGALARTLVMSGNRCTGVQYEHGGELRTAEAGAEVVLCAGAVGSPHLLMLSGIGPADALRAHGIQPVAHLPGVGANLSDHPLGFVIYSAAQPMPEGAQASNHGDTLAAVRTDPELAVPDLHILFADAPFNPRDPSALQEQNGFTIWYALLAPHSRGSVTLVSGNPGTAPAIDPGLLADERDATGMLAGLRVAREVAGSKAMQPWRKDEVLPGAGIGDPGRLRRSGSLGSYFHPVGTCKMGTDASAVTDLQLRVRGIDQLRVVDASVMPSLPGANTNATVLAIAERAADIIKRQN
jgi:choline dehydrogenase